MFGYIGTTEISIHALRVEGDFKHSYFIRADCNFYPRPPGGGRLVSALGDRVDDLISIHALRVEGDKGFLDFGETVEISIHALRVEGDYTFRRTGLRHRQISIHALRVEGDPQRRRRVFLGYDISIHALRVEGDDRRQKDEGYLSNFYPRPPGGGRLLVASIHRAAAKISIHALRVEGD